MISEWKTGTEDVHKDTRLHWGSPGTTVCSDWWNGKFNTCTAIVTSRHWTIKFVKVGKRSTHTDWSDSKAQ